jgi:two-component system cell cycle sensor histidine kinase/response regulator CckA
VGHEDSAAPDERPADGANGGSGANGVNADGTTGTQGDALRASEQRFDREFGRAPFGVVAASLGAGRRWACLAVNDTYCELTGYPRAELDGTDLLGSFFPEDQPALEALIVGALSGATGQIGAADQIEAAGRLVRRDGELVWVHLTGSVIRPATGQPYLAIFVKDITAAEQARAELKRLQLELQRSRRLASLGQLVSGISHDFGNTLTVIANYASLVRDEVTVAETTESAAKWRHVRLDVEQIEEAAERSKRLIKHLLAFTRREEADPVLLDLSLMISDATGLLTEVLGEHVPVVTRQADDLWPVQADPGLLKQAIVNIALNARDAMLGGGQVTIDAMNIDTDDLPADWPDVTDLAELLPGRYVGFRITDTGTGMDAATAERAFEPFFTTKGGDRAPGLGLPAVHRFAAQAGGKAWLRSELGRGTTVTVVLPAAAGSGSPRAARAARPSELSQVLVIDDEAAIRDVAHRVLTSAGYQVMTAANGSEALGLLRDGKVVADLVLTDVVMPGMTGPAFAAQARAMFPGLPVLFMSGYEQLEATAKGWPEPEAQVISKPFSRAALLARVTQALTADTGAGASALPKQRALQTQPGRRAQAEHG